MIPTPPDMIGEAPAFLDALAHASNLAQIDRPVLILGERGTGKELFGARVHFLSPRWEGPFVKVNCAALSDELLESELFGHEAGAFTGASKRHTGRFERAEGGTLFLDEIGTASNRIQEQLLRVIEYGEYERVGGSETRLADVRVVAATNTDLRSAAQTGAFRADLLDRLAFDVISAPPLRERKRDIPLLAAYFAQTFLRENSDQYSGINQVSFTPEAMAQLINEAWPGNVRALKSAIERSINRWFTRGETGPVGQVTIDPFEQVTIAQSTLTSATPDSQALAPTPLESYNLRAHLDNIEKDLTLKALDAHGWNQRKAGDYLQLTYHQIRGLVRKHGLSEPE